VPSAVHWADVKNGGVFCEPAKISSFGIVVRLSA
jgi:hypothetical protein